ncbi:MAG: thioesterase family protein, partial [Actinomycetota bacterium]|nr:thioesterase family protein [Actinomycetota bacterium]
GARARSAPSARGAASASAPAADTLRVVTALFDRADGGFVAHPMTRGPWDVRMMHGGAPAALLAREIERVEPETDMVVARLTVEFLGGVPIGRVEVETQTVKPGKRFQLVEATLDADGRRACLARAVRLRRAQMPAAGATPTRVADPLAPPEHGEPFPGFVERDDGMFYPDAAEIRLAGGEIGSGALAAWIRLRCELVPGEQPSPIARVAAAADFANGLSWILPFEDWLFVNTDLTIHLHREPEGEWIGLDAQTSVSEAGVGVASARLHDLHGPLGLCAQSLFVQRR